MCSAEIETGDGNPLPWVFTAVANFAIGLLLQGGGATNTDSGMR